jgi:hypothetical protein
MFTGSAHNDNDDPRPFLWKATADAIFEKVRSSRFVLEALTH